MSWWPITYACTPFGQHSCLDSPYRRKPPRSNRNTPFGPPLFSLRSTSFYRQAAHFIHHLFLSKSKGSISHFESTFFALPLSLRSLSLIQLKPPLISRRVYLATSSAHPVPSSVHLSPFVIHPDPSGVWMHLSIIKFDIALLLSDSLVLLGESIYSNAALIAVPLGSFCLPESLLACSLVQVSQCFQPMQPFPESSSYSLPQLVLTCSTSPRNCMQFLLNWKPSSHYVLLKARYSHYSSVSKWLFEFTPLRLTSGHFPLLFNFTHFRTPSVLDMSML